MKELIISIYDSAYGFTTKILNDNKIEKVFYDESSLVEFGLYDNEWHWFDGKLINPNNEKIKQFDRIIVCEDGGIDIYIDGKLVLI